MVKALQDDSYLVVLNTLKAVATVASSPKARALLQEANAVDAMKGIVKNGAGGLRKSANTAIDAVQWTP